MQANYNVLSDSSFFVLHKFRFENDCNYFKSRDNKLLTLLR